MSQRGRGSGPHEDDPEGPEAGQDRAAADTPPRSSAARPILPYDPYRSSDDAPRRPARNVAAESFDITSRQVSRRGYDDPFLPDDDPLNAEAWQLEFEEADVVDIALEPPSPEAERPIRRSRRPPAATRERAAGAATTRRAPQRRAREAPRSRERAPRAPITLAMPQVVTGSSLVADPTALLLLGINAVSLLLMALLVGVRIGGVPSPTVLSLDAAGNPNRWGPPSVLWRLPLMAFFLSLMFGVVAWFLHPIDRFAARFALGAALVAQLVTWVAVIQHLFAV